MLNNTVPIHNITLNSLGFQDKNYFLILWLNIIPCSFQNIMQVQKVDRLERAGNFNAQRTDVSASNQRKKELTAWLALIHFIFAVFQVNILYINRTADLKILLLIFLLLQSSFTWFLNRRLLSIEKKKNQHQSKLTHRCFWVLTFLYNLSFLFWIFSYYTDHDIFWVLYNIKQYTADKPDRIKYLTEMFEVDGTILLLHSISSILTSILFQQALFKQNDFRQQQINREHRENNSQAVHQELLNSLNLPNTIDVDIPYCERTNNNALKFKITFNYKKYNLQAEVFRQQSEFKMLAKNMKKLQPIEHQPKRVLPELPDIKKCEGSEDQIMKNLQSQIVDGWFKQCILEHEIYYPQVNTTLLDFLNIKESDQDIFMESFEYRIAAFRDTSQFKSQKMVNVNQYPIETIIKANDDHSSQYRPIYFKVKSQMNNKFEIQTYIQNQHQYTVIRDYSELQQLYWELNKLNKIFNFPQDKTLSEFEFGNALKELLHLRFKLPIFFKFITGLESLTISSTVDFLFSNQPKATYKNKFVYTFIVFDIRKHDMQDGDHKPQYSQMIQAKKRNLKEERTWTFTQRFSSLLILDNYIKQMQGQLSSSDYRQHIENSLINVYQNLQDPFKRAIQRMQHIEKYLNEVINQEKIMSDFNILNFIEDPQARELTQALDPYQDMESHFEVLNASFNSEIIVKEQINNGNTSSLILSENFDRNFDD